MLPQLSLDGIGLVIDGHVVISDIRLLDWKYQYNQQLDNRFLEDTSKPVVAFNIHEKTICLNILGDNERRSLLLRLTMTPAAINEAKEDTYNFIVQ